MEGGSCAASRRWLEHGLRRRRLRRRGADLLGSEHAGRIEHGRLDVGAADVDAQREGRGSALRVAGSCPEELALAVDMPIDPSLCRGAYGAGAAPDCRGRLSPSPMPAMLPPCACAAFRYWPILRVWTISFLARSTNVASSPHVNALRAASGRTASRRARSRSRGACPAPASPAPRGSARASASSRGRRRTARAPAAPGRTRHQLATSCLRTAAINASWRVAPLRERHLQGDADHVGGLLDVVGIDDQRLGHLLRRAGELRQDEHAGVVGVLRRHVLLGHQVHAVAQRRHHADARGAVDAGQPPPRRGAMDVVDRHPVELAEAAVDGAGERSRAAGGCRYRPRRWRASAARSASAPPGAGTADTSPGSGRRP